MHSLIRLSGLPLLIFVAGLTAGCDYYVEYTVRNESDEEVGTGFYFGDCTPQTEARLRGGPLDDRVAPGEEIEVGGVTGNDEVDCVVVRTNDDAVVLIADYVEFGVYVVQGSRVSGEELTMTFEGTGR